MSEPSAAPATMIPPPPPGALQPAEGPPPARTPSGRPGANSETAQKLERVVDGVAVVCGAVLCALNKITGTEWMFFSATVLGVQTGIRQLSARVRGGAVGYSGVLGLAFAVVTSGLLARLAVGALGITAALVLVGCPWRNPAPDCTTPGAHACVADRPHRCMSNGVLRPTRAACGAGETCRLEVPGLLGLGIAACVPAGAPLGVAPPTPATDGGLP